MAEEAIEENSANAHPITKRAGRNGDTVPASEMERAAPTGVVGTGKLEAGLAGVAAAGAAAAPAAASSAAHKTRPSTKLSKIRGAGATSKQFRKAGASAGVFAGTEAAASTQASVGGS